MAATAVKSAGSSASTPIRSIDSIHMSIKNSVGTLIKRRFNHERTTKTEDGSARAYKRTIHTLGDAIIRIFEELIQKMIQISKSEGKQTLGINTFVAAAKLIPGLSTVASAHQAWNNTVDEVLVNAKSVLAQFGKGDKTEHLDNLNQYMAESGYLIRPTALRALVKARLPCRWRLGGGNLTAAAFSVFCCTVAETLLEGAGEQFSARDTKKQEALAPRHISKAIESYGAIKSIIGNAVVIGTPLTHRPQIGRKGKRSRRSAASASRKRGRSPSASPPASPAPPPLTTSESEGEEDAGPPLKRNRRRIIDDAE
jgi:hypothetical protein